MTNMDVGSQSITYTGYYDAECRSVRGVVPAEELVTLYVNGHPLVSLMCTPLQLEELAVGFLYNEGVIAGMEDVATLDLCDGGASVDVWLEHDVEMEAPRLRIITSGCSGGTTFEDVIEAQQPIQSNVQITPQQATALMEGLNHAASLYKRAGGIHAAALSDGERLLFAAEDIGRHNTLDKLAGVCLRQGREMRESILLTSGRTSSEMVKKAVRMETPIIISRTSPTSMAIQLAQAWGLTLIGYTRRRSFRVYSGEERIAACTLPEP